MPAPCALCPRPSVLLPDPTSLCWGVPVLLHVPPPALPHITHLSLSAVPGGPQQDSGCPPASPAQPGETQRDPCPPRGVSRTTNSHTAQSACRRPGPAAVWRPATRASAVHRCCHRRPVLLSHPFLPRFALALPTAPLASSGLMAEDAAPSRPPARRLTQGMWTFGTEHPGSAPHTGTEVSAVRALMWSSVPNGFSLG